jgi:hypothetical protein
MKLHDPDMHSRGEHGIGVYDVGVRGVSVHCISVLGVGLHKTRLIFVRTKLIFAFDLLRKKNPNFLIYFGVSY